MNFTLGPILAELASCLASHAVREVWTVINGWLTKKAAEDPQDLRAMFDQIGWLSTEDIRREVAHWASRSDNAHGLSEVELEDFTAFLINLTRGGRTTRAMIGSQFGRNKLLFEELFKECQTVRKLGESVSPGLPNWKLSRFLGKGTFGEVWQAQNAHVQHRVLACKFFTSVQSKIWIENERDTLNEMYKRLAQEDLANIVQYQDIATEGVEYPYLVFEFVSGGSLEDWILGNPRYRAKLAKNEVIEGIARGLAGAHAAGISHRDLKPANVLLTEDGIPKLADFGLGGVEGMTPTDQLVSRSAWVGTELYLPPEAGDHASKCDPFKQDVFAFGVLWYQLIVERLERPPYDFEEQLREHGAADSLTIAIIRKCLAHPDRRYADANEIYQGMQNLIPETWDVPKGCFDVSYLAREYLSSVVK